MLQRGLQINFLQLLAILRLLAVEKRRHQQITHRAQVGRAGVQIVEGLALLGVVGIAAAVGMEQCKAPGLLLPHLIEVLHLQFALQAGPLQRSFDLAALHAHQRIAALEGVIHKGEWRVLAQAHQPEAEAGQVHRERVLVDSIQAALGDQAAGVDQGFFAMGQAAGFHGLR